ncbi:hypothetical protein J6X15_02670 [Candidatus Saccharibacteria bacterium]|nr:hypothetical protein [Candidatus Saccharibacteria bacterium]
MRFTKKMKLNPAEVAQIRRKSGGYIWVAIDAKRGVIVTGDEYLIDLRDVLQYKYHSRSSNIYGVGLNLRTGEIYYAPVANRMNAVYRNAKEVPNNIKNRIETLLAYFFEDFAPFRTKTQRVYQTRSLQASSC